MNRLLNLLIHVMIHCILCTAIFSQGTLFIADGGTGIIYKKNLDIDGPLEPVLEESSINYHAVDVLNKKIYFSDEGKSLLAVSNTDGSDYQILFENLAEPKGITLGENGELFFIDGDNIMKSNINGSTPEVILSDLNDPRDLTLYNNLLYWTSLGDQVIEVVKPDGTERTVLLTEVFNPISIKIDEVNSEIYWVQATNGIPGSGVFKSDINGENRELVLEEFARGVEIDGELGYLYWTQASFKSLNRYNLANQSNKRFIPNINFPRAITLDKENNKIYFADNIYGDLLHSANLSDGKSLKSIFTTEVYNPDRLAIDTINKKIYWTNANSAFGGDSRGEIMRSDYDGQNIETILSNPVLVRPVGFYLDVPNNHMYWTDQSLGTISRSDLDGTNMVVLVSGLDLPIGLTINRANNKLYWSDWGTDKIHIADLDGQNVEDLITTDVSVPKGLTFNYKESKFYWTDSSLGTISRSDFDGSNVEVIINLDFANSIIIDEENEKIYISSKLIRKVYHAELDGSNFEELISTELNRPQGLFLIRNNMTSTKELSNDLDVTIHPNPTTNVFNIKSDKASISKIIIYNSNGEVVYENRNINSLNHSVNTIEFVSGIYYAVAYLGDRNQTYKIVKL